MEIWQKNILSDFHDPITVSADEVTVGLAVGLTLLAGLIIGVVLFVLNRKRRAR